MKKLVFVLLLGSLSLIMGCSSFDLSVGNPLLEAERKEKIAKLQKKAARLEAKAAHLKQKAQMLNPQVSFSPNVLAKIDDTKKRMVLDAVRRSGDTSLCKTDITRYCTTSGDTQLVDCSIGEDCSSSGDLNFKKVVIGGKLSASGDIALDTVTVAKKVSLSGDMHIKQSVFQDNLSLAGEASVVQSSMQDVTFAGKLAAFEQNECNQLTLVPADHSVTTLKSSKMVSLRVGGSSTWTIFGIIFKKHNNCKKITIVLDGTCVKGDVVFNDGVTGDVVLRNGASIGGRVVSGTLIQE